MECICSLFLWGKAFVLYCYTAAEHLKNQRWALTVLNLLLKIFFIANCCLMSTEPKQPIVSILRPSDSDLSGPQNTNLLCFITGFFPSDISVEWQLNGTKLVESHFTNSPVVAHTSGGFSMHSALILPASQWKEGVYSCIVSHESCQVPITATLENLYGGWYHRKKCK